ncbi:MAG: YcxB family protein [Oscillospiraceae bacterium]|nr:YcxB family protein [Oscillospiraceae bacterium]
MTIHYTVTERDYINFNLHHMNHSTINRILNILIILLPAFLVFRTLTENPTEHDDSAEKIIFYVVLVLTMAFFSALFYLLIKYSVVFFLKMQLKSGKKNDFIGGHTLTLYEDVLEESNAAMSSRIAYSAIEKIHCDYNCYFIYIGAVKALVVPTSAFECREHHEAFLAQLWHKTGIQAKITRKNRNFRSFI